MIQSPQNKSNADRLTTHAGILQSIELQQHNGSRWVICISEVDVANHYLKILINHVFHFRSGNKAERQKRLFYPKKWIRYSMRAVIVSFPKSKNEMIYQAKGVIYLKRTNIITF